jgi:hypothetical protein
MNGGPFLDHPIDENRLERAFDASSIGCNRAVLIEELVHGKGVLLYSVLITTKTLSRVLVVTHSHVRT